MKNRGNINKGWLVFSLGILLFSNNFLIPNVYASELVEETELKENTDTEEINDSEITTQDKVEENTEIELTKEEVFTSYSKNMEFQQNIVMVKGNIQTETTVQDILTNINIEDLITNYSIEKVGITNNEGIWLKGEDIVTNLCNLIFISSDFMVSYQINFEGDLNQDNLITESDIETGIDQFFEETTDTENKEEITKTVSYVDYIIENNTYEAEAPIEEELTINLQPTDNNDKYIKDNITVELELNGLNDNYINTISGQITYNQDILKIENIYILVDGDIIGRFENNQFIYVLNINKETTQPILKIVFQSLKSGTSTISITQLNLVMNGTLLNLTNNTSLNINIKEYGKGGDVEPLPESNSNANNQSITTVKTNTKTSTSSSNTSYLNTKETIPITLSNDNYIKNIDITDYPILFDKNTTRYSIEVENDIQSLNLNITLNNEKSSYFITGNEQFQVGKNEIIITVFAEDGSNRDYVIEVNKKEAKTTETNNNIEQESSKITPSLIILITSIITTLLLIYRLLKKED